MNHLAAVNIGSQFLGSDSHFLSNLEGVGKLTSIFLSNAIIIAGIILLFFFVFGGISLIAGAGNSNPEQLEKGKKAITAALIGFIIVFAAYWIVQLIGQVSGLKII